MEEFFRRSPLALGLGALISLGLYWASMDRSLILAAATAVVLSSLLHVYTGIVAPLTVLALLWGMLARAGVAPDANAAHAKIEGVFGIAQREIKVVASPSSLEEKLAQLKIACDHNIFSAKECDNARTRVVAQFSSTP